MTSRGLVFAPALFFCLAACGGGDASPASTAPPAKSAAPPASSAAPATAKPASTCPEGSTGKGSADEPCTGTGEIIEAVWTKKIEKSGAVFKVTNKTSHLIRFVWEKTYYYDQDGNQLSIPNTNPKIPPMKAHDASGGVLTLQPSETKELALGFSEERIPPAAKNIETVFSKVGWPPDNEPEADPEKWTYWRNDTLAPMERKSGGK